MVSLEFIIDIIHTMALGLTQPLKEMSKGKGKIHPITGHEGPEGE
jgi:hypothetical protein